MSEFLDVLRTEKKYTVSPLTAGQITASLAVIWPGCHICFRSMETVKMPNHILLNHYILIHCTIGTIWKRAAD